MILPCRSFIWIFIILSFVTTILASPNIVINEVMSKNDTTLVDDDGDSVDWLELYNAGEFAQNLAGYGLSDDPADLFKWIFPEAELNSHHFLLVFLSDKNRSVGVLA